MEHAEQMGTAERSSRLNRVIGHSLYLVGTPVLTLTAAAREPGSEAETNPTEWEAAISVWWDTPPSEGPR